MEVHLAPKQPVQVNKITSSCEICSSPHDTQYCMENPEQAFVEYASSRTDEAGGKWYTFKPEQNNLGDTYNPSWKSHPNLSESNLEGLVSNFMASQDARLSKFEADFKQQQSKMTKKIVIVLKAITDRITRALPSDTVKNVKLNVNSTSLVLSTHSYLTKDPQCSTRIYSLINTVTICPEQPNESQNNKPEEEEREEMDNLENINTNPSSPPDPSVSFKNDDSRKEELEVDENAKAVELEVEYFDIFLTWSELAYHKYLMSGPIPSIFLRNPIITEGYLETEHTKSVYLRNEEDKRRGVEYVMSKILRFYKECLELGPEYLTGIADEGEVIFDEKKLGSSWEVSLDDSWRMIYPVLLKNIGDNVQLKCRGK
ncbi:hypothetical protein Tco_0881923 [Tanacetum coccineum]